MTTQNAETLAIRVHGSSIPTDAPGIYVGLTESDRFSATDASRYRGTQYVTSTDLAREGGSFAVTLELGAADIATLDPTKSYSVFSFRAHGIPDPAGAYVGEATLSLDFGALGLLDDPEPEPTTAPTSEPTVEPTTEPTTAPTSEPTVEPTTEPTVEPATHEVTDGSISWGLKESFRKYVIAVGGTITTTSPARKSADNVITFPEAAGTVSMTSGSVSTRGSVTYRAHGGVMNVKLQDPRLQMAGAQSKLWVRVTENGGSAREIVFANVNITKSNYDDSGSGIRIVGAPATLTGDGAKVMGGNYPAGTALDPLNGALALGGGKVPATPTTPPAVKPAPSDTPARSGKNREHEVVKSGGKAGELTWGVKSSWRSYITGPVAKGTVSVSGGASQVGSGYRFGQTTTTATPPNALGTTNYGGAVRFHGHDGTLDRTISQLSVRVTSPMSAVLSATVSGVGRVDLASLNLSSALKSTDNGWVRYAGAPARLTSAGVAVFAYQGRGFYPAGTVLDPVTFSIGTKAGSVGGGTRVVASTTTDEWTAPPTPPATTGLTVEQDELRAGGEVTASGSGFLANESGIRVVLYSTPLVLADDVTADASGRATWTGTLPATIEPGRHTLTFQGSVDRGVVIDVAEAEKIVGCELTDGRLQWGFKESFRAYISGGIANGDWTTGGDAGYETPEFFWTKGSGVLAEDTHRGSLEFGGSIQFTGHDGALDTRVANPVVTFVDEKSAVLSVDYTGGTMDAALAGKDDSKTLADVPFADLDLAAGTRTRQGDRVTITGIPATLTSAGSAAFPNYETGAALDPITLVYAASTDCDAAAPVKTAIEDTSAVALDPLAPTEARDWVTFAAVGGLLALLTMLGATVLIMRRRTPGADA